MKIISDYKDYYDYIFGIYYEKGKVFKRIYKDIVPKEKEDPRYKRCRYYRSGTYYGEYYFLEGKLSFCEKIYPYLIIIDLMNQKYNVYYEYSDKISKIIDLKRKWNNDYIIRNMKNFFTRKYEGFKEEHVNYKTAIVNKLEKISLDESLFRSKELKELYTLSVESINTPLKLLKFYNKMSAQIVYQELDMYISYLDNKESECIIEEKYRIKAKGYNDKSFRKEKGKKRGKKKK